MSATLCSHVTGAFAALPAWFNVLLSHCVQYWQVRQEDREVSRFELLKDKVEAIVPAGPNTSLGRSLRL